MVIMPRRLYQVVNCTIDSLEQCSCNFQKDGFLILEDVIDIDVADKILNQVEVLSRSLCELNNLVVEQTGYLTLVKNKRSAAGAIFNAINKSPSLNRFLFSVQFQKAAEILLNSKFVLAPPRQMNLRTDHPLETNHLYPWHFDYAYNGSSTNSLVFWVPLTAVDEEIGSLHVLTGSHMQSHEISINRKEIDQRKNSALYFEIENMESSLDIFTEERLNLSFGQGVVFHSNLLHKSGQNLSTKTRFAAQSRWFDATSQDSARNHFRGGIDEGVDPNLYIN